MSLLAVISPNGEYISLNVSKHRQKHDIINYTSAYISDESPEDGLVVWMTKA